MNLNIGKNWPLFVCAVGGLLVVIGSFLPWWKAETPYEIATKSGIGDNWNGVFTLILGMLIIATIVISVAKPKLLRIPPSHVVVACSLGVVIIGVMRWIDVNDNPDVINNIPVAWSIGIGLCLVITGGIWGLVGILCTWMKHEKTTSRRKR